jgi:hypothetical protein
MIDIDSLSENKTYLLGGFSELAFNSGTYAYATYTSSEADFLSTDETNESTDKLVITKFDAVNKIISGNFNFKVNDGGNNFKSIDTGKFNNLKW